MKLVFVYPPFCPPTVMPFSISNLKGSLARSGIDIKCIDLNAKIHKMRFPKLYASLEGADVRKYGDLLGELEGLARPWYAQINKQVIHGEIPEFAQDLLDIVLEESPDLVAISLVYNSQCFHAKVLIEGLLARGIKCVVGGEAVPHSIAQAVPFLEDEFALAGHLSKMTGTSIQVDPDSIPDFSDYARADYFAIEPIIPLRSSSTCYYRRCAFCTHFNDKPYKEIDLDRIRRTIECAGAKRFFFIDDMIHGKRLLDLASLLKPLGVTWWAQLKPTKDLIPLFGQLHDSGLRAVCWGLESANQRILDMMGKGTSIGDVRDVLVASHRSGIKNMVYVMFGFPTESKEEFRDTLRFLQDNEQMLFIVSTSVFGLQKGSLVYQDPARFGITRIIERKRKILDESISYEVADGIGKEDARDLRRDCRNALRRINKAPAAFKDYKEQVLLLD